MAPKAAKVVKFNGIAMVIVRMILMVALIVTTCVILLDTIVLAFNANRLLNGFIVVVAVLGVGLCFKQVFSLARPIAWLNEYQTVPAAKAAIPQMLAPIAVVVSGGVMRSMANSSETRSILDSLEIKLDEPRELTRYITGLLVFLGLLGTFWGLMITVDALSTSIGTIEVSGQDLEKIFSDLREGLKTPLAGMAIAFSSSLFGLAGSLLVGFMDLQVGRSNSKLLNEIERWFAVIGVRSKAVASSTDASSNDRLVAIMAGFIDEMRSIEEARARDQNSMMKTTATEQQSMRMTLERLLREREAEQVQRPEPPEPHLK